MIVISKNSAAEKAIGNPTLTNADQTERASLETIKKQGRQAEFGVYDVDTTPPEGQRWTRDFDGSVTPPVAVFEDLPPPDASSVNFERSRRLDAGSAFPVPGLSEPVPLTGRSFDQSVYLALILRAQGYKAAGVASPILTVRGADDEIYTLTPDQMIALISQAMTWVENVMEVSWAMKDKTGDFPSGIPADYTDNKYWP